MEKVKMWVSSWNNIYTERQESILFSRNIIITSFLTVNKMCTAYKHTPWEWKGKNLKGRTVRQQVDWAVVSKNTVFFTHHSLKTCLNTTGCQASQCFYGQLIPRSHNSNSELSSTRQVCHFESTEYISTNHYTTIGSLQIFSIIYILRIFTNTVSELAIRCFEKADTRFMHNNRLNPVSLCLTGQWVVKI